MVTPNPPFALLAELTHRCPLQCCYCSNPLSLVSAARELDTGTWKRVLTESADAGVVQLHLSGGEPLARHDLRELVAHGHGVGLYSNLITSGIGLGDRRAEELAGAGLNSVQLSVQAADDAVGELIAGSKRLGAKRAAASAVRDAGLLLSMNVVLHRHNLDDLHAIVDMCVNWGARRVELANVQYYGWALRNASGLVPTSAQLSRAADIYRGLRDDLAGEVELLWVLPDWFGERPEPCMGGWASRSLTVAPDGTALPCPTAGIITQVAFPNVSSSSISSIWYDSDAFGRYRGTDWLPDPCRSCDRRDIDFGGCRCQAFALLGDAGRTDPVCHLSPDRGVVDRLMSPAIATAGTHVAAAAEQPLIGRRRRPGRRRLER